MTKANIEISIRDMFFYIIQRWRSLIICFLTGALVMGVYGWYISNSAIINCGDTYQVEKAMSQARCIADYETRINDLRNYIGNSDFMKLDPYNVVKGQIKFFTGEDSSAENIGINIARVQYYESILSVSELDSIDVVYGDNVRVDTSDQNYGFFTVEVRDEDRSTVESAIEEIRDIVFYGNSVSGDYIGQHDITEVGSGVTTGYDEYVFNRQRETGKLLYEYTEQLSEEEDQIAEDQKSYINYLIDGYENGYVDEKTELDEAGAHVDRKINVKYIVLGAFIGIIIALIAIVIKYLASGKMRYGGDVSAAYEVACIGVVEGNNKFNSIRHNGLDNYIKRRRYRYSTADEEINAISAKIAVAAEHNGLRKIGFIVDSDVIANVNFIESIQNRLDGKLDITVLRNITKNEEEIEKLAALESAILIGQSDCSSFRIINSELTTCEKFGVDVLGFVMVG